MISLEAKCKGLTLQEKADKKPNCEQAWTKIVALEIEPLVPDYIKQLKGVTNKLPCADMDTFTGGKCIDTNPLSCVYSTVDELGADLCVGDNLMLVQMPSSHKCRQIQLKFLCTKKTFANESECMEGCPTHCNGNLCATIWGDKSKPKETTDANTPPKDSL